jgi:hypothetical protein
LTSSAPARYQNRVSKRAIVVLSAVAVAGLAIYAASVQQSREQAAQQLRRAKHLLSVSVAAAPELADLDAQKASSLLRDAVQAHDTPEHQAWRGEKVLVTLSVCGPG